METISFCILAGCLQSFQEQRRIVTFTARGAGGVRCIYCTCLTDNRETRALQSFPFATFADSEFTLKRYDNTRGLIYCSDVIFLYSSIETRKPLGAFLTWRPGRGGAMELLFECYSSRNSPARWEKRICLFLVEIAGSWAPAGNCFVRSEASSCFAF